MIENHPMTKLRVESFTISIDGFGAGPEQNLENPLGVGGDALHGWAIATSTITSRAIGSRGSSGGESRGRATSTPARGCAAGPQAPASGNCRCCRG